MLQLLGGRWERNPAAEQRICGRRPAQIALFVNGAKNKHGYCYFQ